MCDPGATYIYRGVMRGQGFGAENVVTCTMVENGKATSAKELNYNN